MILSATVVDLSSDGWGVVKDSAGRATFVPGTWPGDEIEYEIVSQAKFRLGKVIAWKKKSSAHRSIPCTQAARLENPCRACSWIAFHYSDQLEAKEKRLTYILQRHKLEAQSRRPILASPNEFHYRNRVKLRSDGKNLGFIEPRSHRLTPIEECLVAEAWINEEIVRLSSGPLISKDYWVQRGAEASFAQGNSAQNEAMRGELRRLLAGQRWRQGLELFCGEGNFTDVLSEHVQELSAYESSGNAIEKLRLRKPEVHARVQNLYAPSALTKLARENQGAEILFLDPPRSGFKELSLLVERIPTLKTIIYLSCDPMTFARDVSSLSTWKFLEVRGIDLFPQTPHLEVMGAWSRNVS